MIGVCELKDLIFVRCARYNQEYPLARRPSQIMPLQQAVGHILAQDVVAGFDIPRQNVSAMDGFALACGSDCTSGSVFWVVGESCAGSVFTGTVQKNQAVRIFTGAVVPPGCDTVVMQEHTNFADIKGSLDKTQPYAITLHNTACVQDNIRMQGEEIHTGETVLLAQKRLSPADCMLLASLGVDLVRVAKPLVVGIMATGDELVALGQPLTNLAQIYNSNSYTLKSLLQTLPIVLVDYGIVPDDRKQTEQTVFRAIEECDVIISSAGVSVGDYDYLTQVVADVGKINQYKVAMKPGKPFVFGEFANKNKSVLYFGLPGNPLSTLVGGLQFVRPALWQLLDMREDDIPKTVRFFAKTNTPIFKKGRRREFVRAYCTQENEQWYVTPQGLQDSHRVKHAAQANCFVILKEECTGVQAGDSVLVEPFFWTLG